MQKVILFITLFFLVACANNTTNVKEPTSKVGKEALVEKPVVELDVEQLIQKIETQTATWTASLSDVTIQDINECAVKDYKGIKKSIFCFAGGKKAQEGVFYYAEGKPIAAWYTLEYYNASPANLADFDATKTIKKRVKIYFQNGDLNAFEKVMDEKGKTVILDEIQSKEWGILTAAIE